MVTLENIERIKLHDHRGSSPCAASSRAAAILVGLPAGGRAVFPFMPMTWHTLEDLEALHAPSTWERAPDLALRDRDRRVVAFPGAIGSVPALQRRPAAPTMARWPCRDARRSLCRPFGVSFYSVFGLALYSPLGATRSAAARLPAGARPSDADRHPAGLTYQRAIFGRFLRSTGHCGYLTDLKHVRKRRR